MLRFERQPPGTAITRSTLVVGGASPWSPRGGSIVASAPRARRRLRRRPAPCSCWSEAIARTMAPAGPPTACSTSCSIVGGTAWCWARSPGSRTRIEPHRHRGPGRARGPVRQLPVVRTSARVGPRLSYSVEEVARHPGHALRARAAGLAFGWLHWTLDAVALSAWPRCPRYAVVRAARCAGCARGPRSGRCDGAS